MQFDFSGFIKQVGEATTIQKNNGGEFVKRELVLTTNEQYPETLVVELTDANAANFEGNVGQPITISYHFNARQGTNGRFYNVIRAWRYTLGTGNYQLS